MGQGAAMQAAVPLFEASITPHRSLGPRGLRRLVAALLLLSGLVSTLLFVLGAWPVIAFNGAEMLVAVLLLRLNARERRRVEVLSLSASELVVRRVDAAGRELRLALDAAWLQAVVEERPGRPPALLLVGRGRRVEVGAALGEAEKRDLAAALRAALHRARHPDFDNPQLR